MTRDKKLIIYVVAGVVLLVLVGIAVILNKNYQIQTIPKSALSEAEARTIAEQLCIKGGEALAGGGTYNPNSQTWWFDANLNATQAGCYPACVVSEETRTAEINWRCTGLILP